MISEQAIKDFQAIWKKQFGEEISDEKATEEALNFLRFLDIIYRPVRRQWLADYDNGKHRQHSQ